MELLKYVPQPLAAGISTESSVLDKVKVREDWERLLATMKAVL